MIRLHEEEGETYKSITEEYGVSKASVSKWCREYSKECQEKVLKEPNYSDEMELTKENFHLRKTLEEMQKENSFLKKRRHSLQMKSTKSILFHR